MNTPAAVLMAKEDPNIPDAYGISIEYLNGKVKDFEAVSHKVVDMVLVPDPNGWLVMNNNHYRVEPSPTPCLEITTADDLMKTVPMTSVQCISYDKRFSKLKEIKEKKNAA